MSALLREAATAIVLRPNLSQAGDGFEVLLVKRHRQSGFMPDAYVFPGGKVDDSDAMPWLPNCLDVANWDNDFVQAQAHGVAAVRELFEEAGVLAAKAAGVAPTSDKLAMWRQELSQKVVTWQQLAKREQLTVELKHWRYFAHWITPSMEPKRFDTRFFVIEMPARQEASPDGVEITSVIWRGPEQALREHAAGKLMLPPPTWYCLFELSLMRNMQDALDPSQTAKVAMILPKIAMQEQGLSVLMPWDAEYATAEGEGQPIPKSVLTFLPSRLVWHEVCWQPVSN